MYTFILKSTVLWVLFTSILQAQSTDISTSLIERDTNVLTQKNGVHDFIQELRRNGEYDSVLIYSEAYLDIAESVNDEEAILDAIYHIGIALYRLDLETFKSSSIDLVNRSKSGRNRLYEARGYKYLSDYFASSGKVDSNLYYLTKAEEVAKLAHNFESDSLLQTLVGQFRHNKATVYYRQQLFDEAIEFSLANSEYAISIGNKDLEMRAYQVLAASYSALFSYGEETGAEIETELYLERSLEFARLFVRAANQTNNEYLQGFAYSTLANMHSMQHELDSALVYYNQSARYALAQKDYLLYSSRVNNIGNIHSRMGEYELADSKFMEAFTIAIDIGNEVMQSRAANNISYNALQLGELNKAKSYALTSIELAESTGRYGTASQGYGNLSVIEEELGNTAAAFNAYKSHIQYRDSLLKVENLQRIDDLQTKYETEKKQAEIEFLQNESKLQSALIKTRNTQFIMVGLILVLVAVSLYLLYQRRLKKQEKELHQINQRLLSVQMNPHFLFNALVSIQSFVLQNREVKDTSNFVAKFAKVTRMVLNYSREPFITLKEELELLNEFLRLQQIRTGNTFDYSFTIDDNIEPDTILIPPMLAQPFIENAVEHGILPMQDERGKIYIEIKKVAEVLTIKMRDNGEGFKQDKHPTSKKSLAIKITGERFELLRKITSKPFSFTIRNASEHDHETGVEVEFCVPIVT